MIQVLLNGLVYEVPETGDENWGPSATDYLVAIPTAVLQKSGGSFTLTAEVDFGANFGLKSIYFKSRSANPSGTGVVRLSASDTIGWRNQANDGNVTLSKATDDSLAISGAGGLTASKVKSSTTDLILDAVTKLVLEKYALFAEQSTPATGPTIPSGYGSFYAGNDGKPYYKSDSGSAIDLSNADVHGPNSSTDNAIATFSGTLGKTLQNTDLTVVTNGTEVDVNAIPDSADTGNALGIVLKAGVKNSGSTSGDGGSASLIGGASSADSGNGGSAVLTGGDAVNGDAGGVQLNGGTTASGVGGDISLVPGSGTTRDGRIIAVGSFGSSIAPADSFDIGSSSFRWTNGWFSTVDTDLAVKTPDLYLKNGANTIQLVPAALTGNRVITFPDVTGKIALTSATNGKTVLTDSVSGILPTANGGTGVNGTATFPSSGTVATVPSSGVVKSNGTVLSSSAVNLASEVTGTLPIANGGTGQTTKAPAFDALSPMSASGDLIYGGTAGTGTRLAKGSDTQVLTLASGLPTWATPVSGFANPMTTGGDLIYGGASGVATRLPNGSSGQVLTSAGGTSAPTWSTPSTQSYELNNVGFATSVGSNILTIALKQSDGSTDPSTGSAAVKAGFRNSSAGTGGYVERSVTSALSLAISQVSSLGLPGSVASYLYLYLIDSNGSGTMKLGASQVKYDEGSLQTTVAESATVTISNGSPGVITETGHTRNANDPIRFTTTGGLPTGLSTGTTYYVLSPISNSYNVSLTPGGAAINTSSAGSGTHTVHCFGYRLASDGNYSNVAIRFIGRGLFNEATAGTWASNSTENSLPLAIDQRQKVYAQYTGNAATVITSNVTNVDYSTKVIDSHGSFNGTQFLAPLTGWYSVNTAILLGGAGSAFDIQYYINAVAKLAQSNGGASSVGRGLGTGFFLNAGDVLSVRLTVGGTLSNSATHHWVSIASQG